MSAAAAPKALGAPPAAADSRQAQQARRESRVAAAAAAIERRRAAGVKAIKAAQRQLGLDDATYRDMLEGLTKTATAPGKRSAKDLDLAQQGRVLDYMRRQGAINPKSSPGRKRSAPPAPERAGLVAKVRKLLDELGRVTGQAYTLAYADAICKRNGWGECVDFCGPRELTSLVGALSRTVRAKAAAAGVQTRA